MNQVQTLVADFAPRFSGSLTVGNRTNLEAEVGQLQIRHCRSTGSVLGGSRRMQYEPTGSFIYNHVDYA